MISAKAATSSEPPIPAAMPALIQELAPRMPRVTAMTTPTTMPASITSRKTMISAPSMGMASGDQPLGTVSTSGRLLNDEKAFGRGFLVVVEETIASRRQRADLHFDAGAARDDLLDAQRFAFEFGGR